MLNHFFVFPTEKPDFISAEMDSRTVRSERHDVVDQRRQESENVVGVVSDVDGSDAVGKLFDLSKVASSRVLQDKLEMAERLDEWNDLTQIRRDFGLDHHGCRGMESNS